MSDYEKKLAVIAELAQALNQLDAPSCEFLRGYAEGVLAAGMQQ